MGIMALGAQILLSVVNVKSFRDYSVTGGLVQISDKNMIDHLDSIYPEACVCDLYVTPGNSLLILAPLRFLSLKNDYQEELQQSLQSQLAQNNDVDVEFFI